jgi:hypothetical protein
MQPGLRSRSDALAVADKWMIAESCDPRRECKWQQSVQEGEVREKKFVVGEKREGSRVVVVVAEAITQGKVLVKVR